MPHRANQQQHFKRYSRYVLLLFVISWLNLIIQAPVHAGMKQQAALSSQMNMANCHCPQTLCDTVLNLEEQSTDAVHIIMDNHLAFQLAFSIVMANPYQQSLIRSDLKYLRFAYDTSRPPPLDKTGTLQI